MVLRSNKDNKKKMLGKGKGGLAPKKLIPGMTRKNNGIGKNKKGKGGPVVKVAKKAAKKKISGKPKTKGLGKQNKMRVDGKGKGIALQVAKKVVKKNKPGKLRASSVGSKNKSKNNKKKVPIAGMGGMVVTDALLSPGNERKPNVVQLIRKENKKSPPSVVAFGPYNGGRQPGKKKNGLRTMKKKNKGGVGPAKQFLAKRANERIKAGIRKKARNDIIAFVKENGGEKSSTKKNNAKTTSVGEPTVQGSGNPYAP